MALPHKAAAPVVRSLRERGLKVVDLSADFRLDRETYERWYQPHEAPELLDEAVYGLPEAHREDIARANLVAAPGCNSTAAILALLPLRGRLSDVVVDDQVSAAELEQAVRTGGGELLAGVEIFDLYRGAQVGEGSKSLALRLEFRAADRTLTDDEVAEQRAAIERELGEIGGSLRA